MSITPHKKADDFKRALKAAARAIAEDPGLEIEPPPDPDNKSGIPADFFEKPLNRAEAICKRGEADAKALRKRYHDDTLASELAVAPGPAREVHDALEQVRVETLGARQMKGVAQNLAANNYQQIKDARAIEIGASDKLPLSTALGLLARERLLGEEIPSDCKYPIGLVRKWIEKKAGNELDKLERSLSDQEAYAKTVYKMLINLDLVDDTTQNERKEGQAEDLVAGDNNEDQDASSEETEDASEEGEDQIAGEFSEIEALSDDDGDPSDDLDSQDAASDEARVRRGSDPGDLRICPWYKVYTDDFDEVIQPSDLANAEELNRLRHQMDRQMAGMHRAIAKLANRLQRYLLARQNRSWEFDREEGILDSAKLTRVVINPMTPLSFKVEKELDFKDTVVTLLIDNSGSMRGKPITTAAISADILARTLERCGIKVEILGFTTKEWKGGRVREKWLSDGKPAQPGRLNELRHIIYKRADMPWRRTKNNLGLMMREGILKENVDGEALLWAWKRLQSRPEERRILMVISDGAPVDDSTHGANSGAYLDNHLREVIRWIEVASEVELIAIGIGHDVTQYYSKAVTIYDPEELSGAMMDQLAELFSDEANKKRDIKKRPKANAGASSRRRSA